MENEHNENWIRESLKASSLIGIQKKIVELERMKTKTPKTLEILKHLKQTLKNAHKGSN